MAVNPAWMLVLPGVGFIKLGNTRSPSPRIGLEQAWRLGHAATCLLRMVWGRPLVCSAEVLSKRSGWSRTWPGLRLDFAWRKCGAKASTPTVVRLQSG
jgi:hypothetical protein